MSNLSENPSQQNSDCNEKTNFNEQQSSDVPQKTPIVSTFVKGLLMGSADAVPGVSGGTIALIVGIYERLVTAISHFDFKLIKLLVTFQIRKALAYIDFTFILSLLCGIGVALVAVLSTMNYLLKEQHFYVLSVFFGLIAGSCILVLKKIHLNRVGSWILFVLGAIFAYWLVGQPFMQGTDHPSLPWLFACGMIAICAMILPGISGSYILLILGEYTYMSGLVKGLVKDVASGLLHGNVPLGEHTVEHIVAVVVFACGCAIGIIGFTKILKILLAKFEQGTLAILCGFMAGSLRNLWPFQQKEILSPATKTTEEVARYFNIAPESTQIVLLAIAIAVVSLVALLAIEWVAGRK